MRKSAVDTCQVSKCRVAYTAHTSDVHGDENSYALANSLGVLDFFVDAIATEGNRREELSGEVVDELKKRKTGVRRLKYDSGRCRSSPGRRAPAPTERDALVGPSAYLCQPMGGRQVYRHRPIDIGQRWRSQSHRPRTAPRTRAPTFTMCHTPLCGQRSACDPYIVDGST